MSVPKEPLPPIDPMVDVPPAVRAAAARSEALMKQLHETASPNPETAPTDAPVGDITSAPVTAPPAAPVVEQPASPPLPEDVQQRIRSAEGRARAEAAARKAAEDTAANLRMTIAAMHAQPQRADPAVELSFDNLVTPQEREAYGDEMLDVIAKRAREVFGKEVETLKHKVGSITGQLQNFGEQFQLSARDQMFAELDREIPEWRSLNRDQNFIQWLGLTDPLSGAIRNVLLNAAVMANDKSRVAAFFRSFVSEGATVDPDRSEPDRRTPSVTLKNLAAPGRVRSAPATAPAEKPAITTSQIAEFYSHVRAGKYRGREADQRATEEQIFAAQREGRVRKA